MILGRHDLFSGHAYVVEKRFADSDRLGRLSIFKLVLYEHHAPLILSTHAVQVTMEIDLKQLDHSVLAPIGLQTTPL